MCLAFNLLDEIASFNKIGKFGGEMLLPVENIYSLGKLGITFLPVIYLYKIRMFCQAVMTFSPILKFFPWLKVHRRII